MSDTPDNIPAAAGVEDFDAFWQSQDRTGKPVRIMGEVYHLPPSMPLEFELLAKRMEKSTTDKDMRRLLSILFGADALTKWTKAGMDAEQLEVLVAWAPLAIDGSDKTLADVRDLLRRHKAGEDVAPDPTGRKSSGTGPTS